MKYFDTLAQDMMSLGLISDTYHSYVFSYDDAQVLINTISHGLKSGSKEVDTFDPTDLATSLARRALTLAQDGIRFDETFSDCCGEAEWRLLDGVSPYAISNPAINSPIVVTHNDEPLGIIKRNKIRTMYGIADMPEHNIVSGVFHKISNDFSPEAPSSDAAWSVALEGDKAPTFEPVRLSIFAIPLEERLRVLDFEDPNNVMARVALQGSHDEIVQSIIYAHLNARPLYAMATSAPV